jgi:hypothetical protein
MKASNGAASDHTFIVSRVAEISRSLPSLPIEQTHLGDSSQINAPARMLYHVFGKWRRPPAVWRAAIRGVRHLARGHTSRISSTQISADGLTPCGKRGYREPRAAPSSPGAPHGPAWGECAEAKLGSRENEDRGRTSLPL